MEQIKAESSIQDKKKKEKRFAMFQFWGRPENHIGLCQDVSRHGLYNPV